MATKQNHFGNMIAESPLYSQEFNDKLLTHCDAIVKKHNLAVEELTEKQMAEAIRQAILSGDFVRCVSQDGQRQAVNYIPYREKECLQRRLMNILDALKGIDATESESKDGWWETSRGAQFGAKKLAEIRSFLS